MSRILSSRKPLFKGVSGGVHKILCTFLLLLALTGCKRENVSGVVVDKHYRPMRTVVTTILCGKVLIPSTHVIPASWIVSVRDSTGKVRSVKVSKDIYSNTRIGQHITFTYGNGKRENHEKRK